MVAMKRLTLAEYEIKFRGLTLALVGALVVAKVVLIMEHVSLGGWVQKQPALLEVTLRTVLYSVGVFVALMLERGFEARHDHGGFARAVIYVFQHREVHHVWADTLGVGCSLLVFNAMTVVQRHLGKGQLRRLYLSPPASPIFRGSQETKSQSA
jgi:hypothetical protein